jgi:putative acetyltransferase
MTLIFRKIKQEDNKDLAELIREIFREYKIDMPGTVYTDPDTDALFELFQTPKSEYFVAEVNNKIIGGSGIFPTEGLPEGCAELVKLYLRKEARGKGIGRMLMDKSIAAAKEHGYTEIYLESFPALSEAVSMYEKSGFKKINKAMGNSGHYACNLWMLKKLD